METQTAVHFCVKERLAFIETSALSSSNVEVAFRQVLLQMYRAAAGSASRGGIGGGCGRQGSTELPRGNRLIVVPEAPAAEAQKRSCCGG